MCPALLDAVAERDALAAKVKHLEYLLEGAGVCVECYANGWHKLDCSRRRAADALDGGGRPMSRVRKNAAALFLVVLGICLYGWQVFSTSHINGLTLLSLILITIGIWRYTE